MNKQTEYRTGEAMECFKCREWKMCRASGHTMAFFCKPCEIWDIQLRREIYRDMDAKARLARKAEKAEMAARARLERAASRKNGTVSQ